MKPLPRTEIGCMGHFLGAQQCLYRRHTQVGKFFRISTVGDYKDPESNERLSIGPGPDLFFETFVFRTRGAQAPCGCVEPADWAEIEGVRTQTEGEAHVAHECLVEKYRNLTPKQLALLKLGDRVPFEGEK